MIIGDGGDGVADGVQGEQQATEGEVDVAGRQGEGDDDGAEGDVGGAEGGSGGEHRGSGPLWTLGPDRVAGVWRHRGRAATPRRWASDRDPWRSDVMCRPTSADESVIGRMT